MIFSPSTKAKTTSLFAENKELKQPSVVTRNGRPATRSGNGNGSAGISTSASAALAAAREGEAIRSGDGTAHGEEDVIISHPSSSSSVAAVAAENGSLQDRDFVDEVQCGGRFAIVDFCAGHFSSLQRF